MTSTPPATPSSTAAPGPAPSAAQAWQRVLSAEGLAYLGYGRLGPWLADDRQQLARDDQAAHAALADLAAAAVAAAGGTPVPADPALADTRVTDSTEATALAIALEERCARSWRLLFSVVDAQHGRPTAQAGLTDSAVRATRWRYLDDPGAATSPFPGA